MRTIALFIFIIFSMKAFALSAQDNKLFEAAKKGSASQVSAALAAGGNVEAVDENGYTALMIAALNRNTEAVQALLRAGANPNYSTPKGYTPLMTAVAGGDKGVTNALLSKGANVTAAMSTGETALDLANRLKRMEIVSLLESTLPKGTQAELAAQREQALAEQQARQKKIEEEQAKAAEQARIEAEKQKQAELERQKAEIIKKANEDFQAAVRHGDVARAQQALNNGATVAPSESVTVVSAVLSGNVDMVKFILAKDKAQINNTVDGKTALIYAIEMGRADMVNELLKSGADPFKQAASGAPISIAQRKNNSEVYNLLVAKMKEINAKKEEENAYLAKRQAEVKEEVWKYEERQNRFFKVTRNYFSEWNPAQITLSPFVLPTVFVIDFLQLPSATTWYSEHPKPVAFLPSSWAKPNSMIAKSYRIQNGGNDNKSEKINGLALNP